MKGCIWKDVVNMLRFIHTISSPSTSQAFKMCATCAIGGNVDDIFMAVGKDYEQIITN